MNSQNFATPVQFEDSLGQRLNRGDIVAFTYNNSNTLEIGVVKVARKAPTTYTLTVEHKYYGSTFTDYLLQSTSGKFQLVKLSSTMNKLFQQDVLDLAWAYSSDKKPLFEVKAPKAQHNFADFTARWEAKLCDVVEKVIKLKQLHKNQQHSYSHDRYIKFTTSYNDVKYFTSVTYKNASSGVEIHVTKNRSDYGGFLKVIYCNYAKTVEVRENNKIPNGDNLNVVLATKLVEKIYDA